MKVLRPVERRVLEQPSPDLDVACRDVCRVLGVVTGEEVVAGRCRHPNIRDWVDAVSLNPARIPPELAGFAAVRAAKMAELAGMS